MPTILNKNGFRFFFYSNENNEPAHIHVEKGDAEGKIWLEPNIQIQYLRNFTNTETKAIATIVFEHNQLFKTKWHEYFS